MKIGVLADHLGLTAEELVTNLKLQEGTQEVEDERAIELIDEKVVAIKSASREEGRKWGHKETLKTVESKLSEATGFSGTFDEILPNLKTGETDPKQLVYKEKFETLQKEFDIYKEKGEEEEKRKKVISKADPILAKYEGKEELKKVALKDILSGKKIEADGDDILLLDEKGSPVKVDGKYVDFHGYVEIEFDKLFNKVSKKNFPKTNGGEDKKDDGPVSYENINMALEALRKAKTPEEKSLIQKWIEKNS